jgi:oligopeptide/dipeptide ABC transporter ATP-binding protein
MEELLRVEELKTYFETRDFFIRAVDGVSFSIRKGGSLGIVGESGSGKSMTSLSIIRLVPRPGKIVSGSIYFDGRDLLTLPEKEMRKLRGKDIAMIFQDPLTALNPVLTIGKQVAENLFMHEEITSKEAFRRTVELLEMVQIPAARKRISDYPHQFSGGMRQRVMIAMALACKPRFLIADEPTTALDVTVQAQIIGLLQKLARDMHMALLLITHNLGIVRKICEDILVMYSGIVVESSPSDRLLEQPLHPYTQGLLNSIPRLKSRSFQKLVPIDAQPSSSQALSSGCVFHPRCSKIIRGLCDNEIPPFTVYEDGHCVRCFLYEQQGR